MDDELLDFEMTFRSIPYTAETTREEKIRLILQHQSPSLPSKAKSPAAKVTGTYLAPNLSSPPIPVPPKKPYLKQPDLSHQCLNVEQLLS